MSEQDNKPAFVWKDSVAIEAQRRERTAQEKKRRKVDDSNQLLIWGTLSAILFVAVGVLLLSGGDFYGCNRRCSSAHAMGLLSLAVGVWAAWLVVRAIKSRLYSPDRDENA